MEEVEEWGGCLLVTIVKLYIGKLYLCVRIYINDFYTTMLFVIARQKNRRILSYRFRWNKKLSMYKVLGLCSIKRIGKEDDL